MYAPTPGEDEEEDKEEEGITQLTPRIARSVDDGAAIVETDLYKVMEAPFKAKRVWDDIINVKLEWFMLIAVLVLFLDDKKNKFTATLLKDDTAEENVPVLLTNVVESLPPWLLVQEWTRSNLYNWPEELSEETESPSGNRVTLESALVSSLVDRFIICRPGEDHPILLFASDSNRTLRHRISSTKAEFLKSILNELKNEAMYGTQWLIKERGKESSSGSRIPATPVEPGLRWKAGAAGEATLHSSGRSV
ncbi:hypothetical protein O3P69_019083 [Scylla paramamosain]|uniref:Uncharacterized protein n=1 Tax=Scylla paramamosain TaxID=85552 RepID=A0AAW0T7A7_SCYPA